MTRQKKMTSKGSLTIPKDLRADAGLVPGMAVDLEHRPDGVLIKKHVPVCRFCGSTEEVITVTAMMKIDLCRSCGEKILEGVKQHDR